MRVLSILLSYILFYGLQSGAQQIHRGNIALNKTAYQSSTFEYEGYNWTADFVLDGNANYSESCKCCSLTSGNENPWLEIDLGRIYPIGRVEVYGRPDVDYQLRQFEMLFAENSTQSEFMDLVYTNHVSKEEYKSAEGHFTIILGNSSAQYIRIQNKRLDFQQMVICEIEIFEACDSYYFEPFCSPCHCSAAPCNKTTGLCPTNCKPGWQGPSCNTSCKSGTYGVDCMGNCTCLNPEMCDKLTGECTDGNCVLGFKGKYCNISTVISLGKPVKMSDQFQGWKAERAVDGDFRTKADECQCCAATEEGDFPWFEIDLEVPSRIEHLIVYGRTDKDELAQSFMGLSIYPEKHNQTTGIPIFINNSTTYFLNITLEPPVITQYITLKQIEDRLLVICELQLFDGGCDDGNFGALCNETCHCYGPPCNTVTGKCPSETCLPGYRGNSCSEACGINTYGLNCSLNCGKCSGNETCDHVTGHCSEGCKPGYVGFLCNESCDINTYGLNCSLSCGKCRGNETCDHVTGHCSEGCKPGYVGILCHESCGFGKYGNNCAYDCGNCANNRTCNISNGQCADLRCAEGYIPPSCFARTKQQQADSFDLSTGTLAAILCFTFAVLTVAIFAIVFFRKRISKVALRKEECQTNVSDAKDGETNAHSVPLIQAKDAEIKKDQNMDISTFDNIGTEYYAFVPRKEDIKIYQIWDYVHKGMENNSIFFFSEFESLAKGLQYEFTDATKANNRLKNRYKNIYAYDDNRVKLLPLAIDPSESDYINASYVDGFEKVAKFIASQGPTKEMVNDFWRMIWQQQCNVIVMLTNVYENDVQKCLQYWPYNEEAVTFGNVVVKLLRQEQHTDYFLRYLEIDDYDNNREIKHYHFTSWPDKTTPDTAWSLVNFWRAVVEGSKSVLGPIVVHCSAGVGRTGTFIALDNLYNQGKCEGCIRPLQMVEALRKQRVNMVQTKEQYVFLHEAVAEAVNFGTHYITPEQFDEVYNYLIEPAADGSKTNMEEQFDLIEMSLQDCESAERAINKHRNEAEQIGELTGEEITRTETEQGMDSVYDNVSASAVIDNHQKHAAEDNSIKELKRCLLNYKDERAFILLPAPKGVDALKNLVDVIITERVNTIILLENEADRSTALISNNNTLDGIGLKVQIETEKDGWAQKDLSIAFTKKNNNIAAMPNVRLLEFFDWNTCTNTPKNTKGFSDLLSEIISWQTTQSSKKTPIVLISDETTRCGLLCVALDEKMRATTEGRINIIESVKKIRLQERNFISSFTQYKFCYDVTKMSVQQSDLYANFL